MRSQGRSLHDSFYSRDCAKKKRKKQPDRVEPGFRALAESLPEMVVSFDKKMRCMFVNSVFEQITGFSLGQFYGKTSRKTGIPKEVVKSWKTAMASAIETGRNTGIYFSFPQTSGLRSFSGDIIPVFDGNRRLKALL